MIPLVDFKAEYKEIRKDVDIAISRVLGSGWYILGSEVANFEKEIAKYIGVKYAVGVASGTDALTLAVKSLDLKPKDKVLVPANVYPTIFGVCLSGVQIALCDVDPKSLNVTLDTIKKAYTKEVKAILIVHLYGNPVDIDPIRKFARSKNVYLIEDCAQSLGSKYRGRMVGTFGDVSTFSFYPTKNLGAYGDGGAVLTNNKKFFERIKLLRMYGEAGRYNSILLGHNSRLDEFQAAILSSKFNHLDGWKKRKDILVKLYKKLLKPFPVEILSQDTKSDTFFHLFVIKTERRDELMKHLANFGILTGIHYPTPIHLTKTFSFLGYKRGSFPNSEKASDVVLSLPLYPQMKIFQVKQVVEKIRNFFESK